ncbi:MAG: ABC transporter permease [Bacteroidales bacterium]|nr:ABC transporter permease [Bacteroidales bacterium]
MKSFGGFVIKEFNHIFRDRRTMLVLFGIPVAQLLIFGYVVTNEFRNFRIAIFDMSQDEVTRELTGKILSSGYFILDESLTSTDGIDEAFKKGHIKEVVIFGQGFGKRLEKEGLATVQVIADASDANTANLLVNYTNGIIQDFAIRYRPAPAHPPAIRIEERMIYNAELKGVYMFVPGTMALILMLVSAMMTSISIAREKEMGTLEVLLISPLKPYHIIAGKVIPYVVLSFINAVVILLLGFFVFGMPVRGSLALLLSESLLFISLALSLGIFISTLAGTQQVAMFISMFALMLPTLLLSGFIFPVENMPLILQWISALMPPKYFITIIKDIMLKGSGLEFVWEETLILAGMTLLFIFLSVRRFKTRFV